LIENVSGEDEEVDDEYTTDPFQFIAKAPPVVRKNDIRSQFVSDAVFES